MITILTILITIVCVLLTLVVLVQNPKGGGLASGFSSANQIGGVKRTADFLEKSTWTLVIVLMLLSVASSSFMQRGDQVEQRRDSELEELMESAPRQQQQQGQPQPGQPQELPDFDEE